MNLGAKSPSVKPEQRRVRKHDPDKVRRRTPKACDRCRLKKAKCDGHHFCKTCRMSDSVCTYTARRSRDTRNYYSQMCGTMDEALRMLFASCKKSSNFPGVMPEEDEDGLVTTSAILKGLGLLRSDTRWEEQNNKKVSAGAAQHGSLSQSYYQNSNPNARLTQLPSAVSPSNQSLGSCTILSDSFERKGDGSETLCGSETSQPATDTISLQNQSMLDLHQRWTMLDNVSDLMQYQMQFDTVRPVIDVESEFDTFQPQYVPPYIETG